MTRPGVRVPNSIIVLTVLSEIQTLAGVSGHLPRGPGAGTEAAFTLMLNQWGFPLWVGDHLLGFILWLIIACFVS